MSHNRNYAQLCGEDMTVINQLFAKVNEQWIDIIPPTITASAGPNGTINPSGVTYVSKGQSVTYTISANDRYVIDELLVDGILVEATGCSYTYTFENVRGCHTINVSFVRANIYTIRFYKNKSAVSGDGVLELYSDNISQDVSSSNARFKILQDMGYRPCLIKQNYADKIYLDESNLTKDVDGNSVTIDGSGAYADYDVMREVPTLWWYIYDNGTYADVSFSNEKFTDGCVTAHTFGGKVRKYIYWSVFNGYSDSTRLRSIATSNLPTASQNITWFSNRANVGGSGMSTNTYYITNHMDRILQIILTLWVYGTKNVQTVVCGLNNGSGSSTSACRACNSGFSATGGFTQGTTANYNTCCMAIGLMNLWGKIWNFDGDCIYNGGNWKFAYDGADHYDVAGGSYSGAPANWINVYAGTFGNDSYIKEISYNSLTFGRPTATGGSSTTYECDNAWYSTGDRVCFSGACVSSAAGKAGVFAVSVNDALSHSDWYFGARLKIFGTEEAAVA